MDFANFGRSSKGSKSSFLEAFGILAVCSFLYIFAILCDSVFHFSGFFMENSIWYQIVLFFSVVISLSIFLISFYTYPQIKHFRMIAAGCTFLIIGLLDGVHVFNFPGVFFEAGEWVNKTSLVWVLTRLLNAVGFSFIANADDQNPSKIRRGSPLILSFIIVVMTYSFAVIDPFRVRIFEEGNGLTTLGLIFITSVSIFYIYSFYRIFRKYGDTGDSLYKMLAIIFLLMFFNSIAIMNTNYFFDSQNFLGQIFQLASYTIFFNIFFIHGIKRPYILLSEAKEQLNGSLAELDHLVDKRTTELRCINEKLLADQEIARGIQLSMLPASLPGNNYVTFSAGYVPAENLSGDFYNVFKIDEDRFGICIGDVSGHGISAAMLSIFTFQKMQSLMEEEGGESMTIPSLVLKDLYESFNSANFNEDMYIVMLYGVFNSQTGIFSYASGGLNTSPLRIRPDGSIQELDNDGFAICKLGDLLKPKFVNRQILLFPGDKLIIFTDGLTDARDKDQEKYSLDRLKRVILGNYKWDVEYLSDAIIKDVKNYTSGRPADDVTLLVVDVLPPF